MDKAIMTFKIFFEEKDISSLQGQGQSVTMIPFSGSVESELFTGSILPGACDVQTEDAAKIRKLSARYMFEGKDSEGNKCKLFVENTGFISPETQGASFIRACPSFISDSPLLSEKLSKNKFYSHVKGSPSGVEIIIFESDL